MVAQQMLRMLHYCCTSAYNKSSRSVGGQEETRTLKPFGTSS